MINYDNYNNEYATYFCSNLDLLERAYFTEERVKGIPIKNSVNRNFETNEIVEKRLKKGIIDEVVVAWKAGRIKNDEIEMLDGNYLNGYGRQINKEKMDNFISKVADTFKDFNDYEWTSDNFSKIYRKVIESADIPDFFGVVYIINLIFFMSRGKLPIYDKFAHKALKALFMGKSPSDVYVGAAPEDKKNIEEVSAMYMEYIWLLQNIFGKYEIDRKLDRALWAFGHANSEWML